MKERVKKIIHFISVQPIIGGVVRFLVSVVRIPRIIDEIRQQNNDLSAEINGIKQDISGLHQKVSAINHEVSRIGHELNNVNLQINHLNHLQKIFDEEYLPKLKDSLDYQDNLKKSLPVALRRHHRLLLNNQKN